MKTILDKYIISENDTDYLVTPKAYLEILDFLHFKKFSNQKASSWLQAGKIAGENVDGKNFYYVNKDVFHICFGQTNGYTCGIQNCRYKETVKNIGALISVNNKED